MTNYFELHSPNISTRFLTLLAHFFILICLLWNKEENFRLCTSSYIEDDALHYHREYTLVLGLSIGSIIIEYLGLLSGISMFSQFHCLLSIICHTAAAITWSISYIEKWNCSSPFDWYIFLSCSIPPLLSELMIFFRLLNRIISS